MRVRVRHVYKPVSDLGLGEPRDRLVTLLQHGSELLETAHVCGVAQRGERRLPPPYERCHRLLAREHA
jgi:hypothetical protein